MMYKAYTMMLCLKRSGPMIGMSPRRGILKGLIIPGLLSRVGSSTRICALRNEVSPRTKMLITTPAMI